MQYIFINILYLLYFNVFINLLQQFFKMFISNENTHIEKLSGMSWRRDSEDYWKILNPYSAINVAVRLYRSI